MYVIVMTCDFHFFIFKALQKKRVLIGSSLDDILATFLVDVEVFQRGDCNLLGRLVL